MLDEVRIGNMDDDVEKLLQPRFIYESDEDYWKVVLHIYAENEPAIKSNDVVLNYLPGETYTIEAHDKIPDNCKYPLVIIQPAQIKKTNTGGLAKLLKLKIYVKMVLTVNLDIQDCLINDQTGKISYIDFAQGIAEKV